jgi:hypothetical protein
MDFLLGAGLFAAGVACGALLVGPACLKAFSGTLRAMRDDFDPKRRRAGQT